MEKENSILRVGAFTEESSREISFTVEAITRGVAVRCTKGLSLKEKSQVCAALFYLCVGHEGILDISIDGLVTARQEQCVIKIIALSSLSDRIVYRPSSIGFNPKGHGEMIYADFHRYVGQWLDNKKHGTGSLSYREGHVYMGEWVQDERHGNGIMTFSPGTVSEEVCPDSH